MYRFSWSIGIEDLRGEFVSGRVSGRVSESAADLWEFKGRLLTS